MSLPPTETRLKDLFLSLQTKLDADLQTARLIKHPGEKGSATELDWLGMLTKHLPSRYQATKAFVLDADGNLSEQIDVVIHDRQYSPLLFEHSGVTYLPAESVYAVLEVKQDLSKTNIEYAAKKVGSVRKLRRTSAPITYVEGIYEPKKLFNILGGILALESTWAPPLGDSFKEITMPLPDHLRLDLGCALKHGAFEISIDEKGQPLLSISRPETALIVFFLRLVHRLQQLGTVPAIDLREYGKGL